MSKDLELPSVSLFPPAGNPSEPVKLETEVTDENAGIPQVENNSISDSQETKQENPKSEEEIKEEGTLGQKFFELLKADGVLQLPEEYEFGGELSDLRSAFEYQNNMYKQQVAENFLNSVPEQLKDIYEASLSGVEDINELLSLKRKQTYNYDTTTLDSQRAIIKTDLQEKGISDSVIDNIIQQFEKEGTIEAEATTIADANKAKAEDEIRKMKEAREQEQLRAKQEQEQLFNEFYQNVSTTLASSQWSDNKKKEIETDLFKVDSDGLNAVAKKINHIYGNPEALINFVDFLSYYDPEKGFDLAAFKQIEEKESRKLKDKWEETLTQSGGIGTRTQESDPKDLDLGGLSLFPIRQ